MENKNILITGGAGFIGSNLAKALCEKNNVTIIDNLISGHRENLIPISSKILFVEGDIRNKELLEKITINQEIVFHLAASVGNKKSIDFPLEDAEINVIGTINLLEASRKNGVKKIITSSSAGIFGELKTLPIKEDHPIEPDTPYGSTKLCEEKLCLSYAKLYDLNAICLRYFNVYGPNQRFDAYGNVIPIFVFKMLNGEKVTIFGDGEQTRDFINVNDVVQANIKAAESENINGAFNIASGTRISINQLIALISKNHSLITEHGPKRPGDVLHSLADISLAKQKLGFEPIVKLEEGIKEYIKWAQTTIG